LWALASFRNFYKSLHTQGINVFRAPLTGNHHTLQGDAGSDHVPGSGGNARSKEFVLLVTGERRRVGQADAGSFFTTIRYLRRPSGGSRDRGDAKPD